MCCRENADARQPCQGECQHTSCETCRLVPRYTDCGKCAAGDLHCLRQFGKCMRRELCALGVGGRGDKMAAQCRAVQQPSRDSNNGKQVITDVRIHVRSISVLAKRKRCNL